MIFSCAMVQQMRESLFGWSSEMVPIQSSCMTSLVATCAAVRSQSLGWETASQSSRQASGLASIGRLG